eukprot:212030-Pelagomonas_calceolata.AAC.1
MDSASTFSQAVNAAIRNMVTERHNIASRMILNVVSEGSYGSSLIHMDVGSADRLSQHNLHITEQISNRIIPPIPLGPQHSCLRTFSLCNRQSIAAQTPLQTPPQWPAWALFPHYHICTVKWTHVDPFACLPQTKCNPDHHILGCSSAFYKEFPLSFLQAHELLTKTSKPSITQP